MQNNKEISGQTSENDAANTSTTPARTAASSQRGMKKTTQPSTSKSNQTAIITKKNVSESKTTPTASTSLTVDDTDHLAESSAQLTPQLVAKTQSHPTNPLEDPTSENSKIKALEAAIQQLTSELRTVKANNQPISLRTETLTSTQTTNQVVETLTQKLTENGINAFQEKIRGTFQQCQDQILHPPLAFSWQWATPRNIKEAEDTLTELLYVRHRLQHQLRRWSNGTLFRFPPNHLFPTPAYKFLTNVSTITTNIETMMNKLSGCILAEHYCIILKQVTNQAISILAQFPTLENTPMPTGNAKTQPHNFWTNRDTNKMGVLPIDEELSDSYSVYQAPSSTHTGASTPSTSTGLTNVSARSNNQQGILKKSVSTNKLTSQTSTTPKPRKQVSVQQPMYSRAHKTPMNKSQQHATQRMYSHRRPYYAHHPTYYRPNNDSYMDFEPTDEEWNEYGPEYTEDPEWYTTPSYHHPEYQQEYETEQYPFRRHRPNNYR